MSSFVGHTGNQGGELYLPNSTGYVYASSGIVEEEQVDIVEEFPCEGDTTDGILSLDVTDDFTFDLGSLAGKGLLLKIIGTDSIIGYGVISPANGVPPADVVIKDILAIC